MRLSIRDTYFVPDREGVQRGHLIWPDECPKLFIDYLELNQGYRGMCEVVDQGRVIFSGPTLVKRRKHQGGRDLLVFLLSDVDIGQLSPNATIGLDPRRLEFE